MTPQRSDVPYRLAKRIFDRGVAAVLLMLLSPLLLLALTAIALDMLLVPRDRGRWLYRERRISRGRRHEPVSHGRNNRAMRLLDFRQQPARRLSGEAFEVVDEMHLVVIAERVSDLGPRSAVRTCPAVQRRLESGDSRV